MQIDNHGFSNGFKPLGAMVLSSRSWRQNDVLLRTHGTVPLYENLAQCPTSHAISPTRLQLRPDDPLAGSNPLQDTIRSLHRLYMHGLGIF